MPYISKKERELYDKDVDSILSKWDLASPATFAGDFTYIVYRLLKRFSGKFWMRALGVGCVIMAILELYRTDHGPYEEAKREVNGDVDR